MVKRIVAVTVAAGALAVPAIVSGDKGGTPNRHSPAWQCRHAGLSPAVETDRFAECVRRLAGGQQDESRNPAAQCRHAGLSPAVEPHRFAECVRKQALTDARRGG
jgi:hypothetical protein